MVDITSYQGGIQVGIPQTKMCLNYKMSETLGMSCGSFAFIVTHNATLRTRGTWTSLQVDCVLVIVLTWSTRHIPPPPAVLHVCFLMVAQT